MADLDTFARLLKTRSPLALTAWLCTALALVGCASAPAPRWQTEAVAHMARYTDSWMQGQERVAQRAFEQARAHTARTARPDWLARIELSRCALHVAALIVPDGPLCPAYEALADAAAPEDQAYARWLQGQASVADVALLPPVYRPLALGPAPQASAVQGIADPLSRLVAAGVLLRQGRAQPQVLALAVQTASDQGWARPLMGWLHVQARQAEQSGQHEQAAHLRRRMALLKPTSGPEQAPAPVTPPTSLAAPPACAPAPAAVTPACLPEPGPASQ